MVSCERWQAPIGRTGILRVPDTFSFLNRTSSLDEIGWDNPAIPRLWRYQLHYFDWMADNAIPTEAQATLIERWIAGNPPPASRRIGTAWEPYPLSMRIVNWIKWDIGQRKAGCAGLNDVATLSLAVQVRQLAARLEYHLLGNHLWANAKALVFAGCYFEGREASDWLQRGVRLLLRELAEQVLPDGGHFELSPMYHALFLEDLLDLLNLSTAAPGLLPGDLSDAIAAKSLAMLRWLRVMTHPDGRPAQFNDCDLDGAPVIQDLASYATRVGLQNDGRDVHPAVLLKSSGYARLARGPAVVLADVGKAGPDYMPGHAHADALSFELSLWGMRMFVNGGTSTYEVSSERSWERGSAAHNTVTVDGRNSSEVWSSFRLGRRIEDVNAELREDQGEIRLMGSFTGFHDGAGSHSHRREWVLTTDRLEIHDEVKGLPARCVARLRLAPGWKVAASDGGYLIGANGRVARLESPEQSPPRVESGRWSPGFGKSVAVKVICMPFNRGRNSVIIRWMD